MKFKKIISMVAAAIMCTSMVCAASINSSAATKKPYQQAGQSWSSKYFGGYTFGETGCGIMSLVNAVNYLTGNFMEPLDVAQWAKDIGAYNSGFQGTNRYSLYPNVTAKFGARYGFKIISGANGTDGNSYNTTLQNHLAKGGVAVGHVYNHFIALVGYKNGQYLVYDSAANASRRGTSTAGNWLTPYQMTGSHISSYMNLDWFTLISATTSTAQAAAAKPAATAQSFTFDAGYYADKYSDLKRAFGYNQSALYSHWINNGIREGRSASLMFDVRFYLDHNADLKRAFGNNFQAAYDHFIRCGYNEGRAISPVFYGSVYRQQNADLKSLSSLQLMQHFVSYGINEGRISSPWFSLHKYAGRYSDLRAAFGTINLWYYRHFAMHGYYEGRIGN